MYPIQPSIDDRSFINICERKQAYIVKEKYRWLRKAMYQTTDRQLAEEELESLFTRNGAYDIASQRKLCKESQ